MFEQANIWNSLFLKNKYLEFFLKTQRMLFEKRLSTTPSTMTAAKSLGLADVFSDLS